MRLLLFRKEGYLAMRCNSSKKKLLKNNHGWWSKSQKEISGAENKGLSKAYGGSTDIPCNFFYKGILWSK